MILVGLGANLPSSAGPPQATLAAALEALEQSGVRILKRSRWYRSAPVPASDQPDFVNGVALVDTALAPDDLLALLHRIEARFGRQRREPNAPRTLDLDLLAYGDRIVEEDDLVLPHPRLGLGVAALIAALPPGQRAEPVASAGDCA